MPLTKKLPKTIENYIGGEMVPPAGGKYFDNFNPATGGVYSRTPDSGMKDVVAAVKAADKIFPEWAATPAEKRSRILHRIADLIEQNLDILAWAETTDNGKPLSLSKSIDIPRAAANFRFFANGIVHFDARSHSMESTGINYTLRQPVGLVGCISPWNLPLYLFTWKIAPALAAGNCVIAKPSEVTPMSAHLLAGICTEAGLPPGVLNIIHGYGSTAGKAVVSHPAIKAISFTGGTKTGRDIAKTVAPFFKKLSLEMGGKNPNIIFADCDFDEMMRNTLRSSFQNQGQLCLCGSRILVERPLYERFRDEFIKRTKKLRVGDPLSPKTRQGAIVSAEHFKKILGYIELAKKEGGAILTGGKPARVPTRCKNGWFIEPTVIEGLKYRSRTNQEEIFGPVVTLMPFDTEEDAIRIANSTEYGLSASVWTQNLSRAHRVAALVESGIIWVNCWLVRDLRTPFGGMKNSGLGREGGWNALEFFTEPKNVCITI